MADIREIVRSSARLAVLRYLGESPSYHSNTSVVQEWLATIALDMTRGEVETLCAWLAERDLVTVESIDTIKVVRLSTRGADVVAGRVVVDGVKRPSPGDVMRGAANAARSLLDG